MTAMSGGGGGASGKVLASVSATSINQTTNGTTPLDLTSFGLVLTFTAPASGNVLFGISAWCVGLSGAAIMEVGVGVSTVSMSSPGYGMSANTTGHRFTAAIPVTGLTSGTSYTYSLWYYSGANLNNVSILADNGAAGVNKTGPAEFWVVPL